MAGTEMAAVEAEERDPRDVLAEAEPLSRESLTSPEVVEALWAQAERVRDVNQTVYGVEQIYRAFEHSNCHRYELRTALDYHGVLEENSERMTSEGFRQRLRSD